jgi:hypothetical protein
VRDSIIKILAFPRMSADFRKLAAKVHVDENAEMLRPV